MGLVFLVEVLDHLQAPSLASLFCLLCSFLSLYLPKTEMGHEQERPHTMITGYFSIHFFEACGILCLQFMLRAWLPCRFTLPLLLFCIFVEEILGGRKLGCCHCLQLPASLHRIFLWIQLPDQGSNQTHAACSGSAES